MLLYHYRIFFRNVRYKMKSKVRLLIILGKLDKYHVFSSYRINASHFHNNI